MIKIKKQKSNSYKPRLTPQYLTNQRSLKRSKRKKSRNCSKKSKPKEILKKVALPLPHQEAMLSKLQVIKRRKRFEISLRSLAIAITKRAIMPLIALSLRQKNSCSLGNLYISNYMFGGQYETLLAYALYPVSGLILGGLA